MPLEVSLDFAVALRLSTECFWGVNQSVVVNLDKWL